MFVASTVGGRHRDETRRPLRQRTRFHRCGRWPRGGELMRGRLRRRPCKSREDTWELIVDVEPDPVTGKRRRRYKAFQGTRKQAEKALAELVQEVQPGSYVDPVKRESDRFLSAG